jgi:serine/threonine protein kinase
VSYEFHDGRCPRASGKAEAPRLDGLPTMFLLSSGALIDLLGRHKLLAADQLSELPALVSSRSSDGRALAKVLVHRGWISFFQAHQLLGGRADELSLGPYRILDMLGQGGLGRVYKARHIDNNWIVALKVIRPEVLTTNEGREQFLKEMEAMARLDHPNIVQFCDVDQANGQYYYAMEYVEGTDLGRFIQLAGPLPVLHAANFVYQVALGLQNAHEHNLVHRDIKPVNLYLTLRAGTDSVGVIDPSNILIKILDWGLASLKPPDAGPADESGEGMIIGTADYFAPEQALNPLAADIRSDIYSLGCTLYYLLSGQPPFPDGTLDEKIQQHQAAEPAPLSSFRNDLPLGLTMAIKRMMAKRPEERYRTPDALAIALKPFMRPGKNDLGKHDILPFLNRICEKTPMSGATLNKLEKSLTLSRMFQQHTIQPTADTAVRIGN